MSREKDKNPRKMSKYDIAEILAPGGSDAVIERISKSLPSDVYALSESFDLIDDVVFSENAGAETGPVIIDVDPDSGDMVVLNGVFRAKRAFKAGEPVKNAYVGDQFYAYYEQDNDPKPVTGQQAEKYHDKFMAMDDDPDQLAIFIDYRGDARLRACGTRIVEGGMQFLIGVTGRSAAATAAGLEKKRYVERLTGKEKCPKTSAKEVLGVTVHKEDLAEVFREVKSGSTPSTRMFHERPKIFPWEGMTYQTREMTEKIPRYQIRGQRELEGELSKPEGERDYAFITELQDMLASIEDYLDLPVKSDEFRDVEPVAVDLPCNEIAARVLGVLGCHPPVMHMQSGRRNPIGIAGRGTIKTSGGEFPYQVDVVRFDEIVLSHNEDLNVNEDYPVEFRPRTYSDRAARARLRSMAEHFSFPTMHLPGPDADGSPVVWWDGRSYVVLDGNLRLLAFKTSPRADLRSDFYNKVMAMTGRRGVVVRVLQGTLDDAVRYVKSVRHTAMARNPVLMVGNPVDRNIKPEGYIKEDVQGKIEEIPVYPQDEQGYPAGAIPIDEIDEDMKSDPSFKKSWDMFVARNGGPPDYIMPVKVPGSLPTFLSGIGQLKQTDYYAADGVDNAGTFIHWWHPAGEQGDGKAYSRPAALVADPETGMTVIAEMPGSVVKFTPRGIVG